MGLQLWPARKPVETRDLELRVRQRFSAAGLEQVLGLILQMPEIGAVRKRACHFWGMGRHCDLLSSNRPLSADRAERRFAKFYQKQVGFYPFRGPDASLTRRQFYTKARGGATQLRGDQLSYIVASSKACCHVAPAG